MKKIHSLALVVATGILFVTTAPLPASEMDDRIVAAAEQSNVFKTHLQDDSVKVASANGVVSLTGTVAQESHKSLAQDTVASLPGVTSVDNQISVSDAGPEAHSDLWIGLKVKNALLFHRSVSAAKTDVNVADGVVTLSGEAANQAQKDLTGEYAKDVEGVKGVQNDMTLDAFARKQAQTPAEKIDDASITAQVKSALMSRHSTSALKTHVATIDGVVTLSGIAKNDAEKSLVTKLVSDINGVNRVVNNMTIGIPVAAK